MDFQAKLNEWMPIITAVVTVSSAIASLVNAVIRSREAGGAKTPGWALTLSSVLNIFAANIDKASQLGKMAAGKDAPKTQPPAAPVEPPKADAPVAPAADAPKADTQAVETLK